MVGFLYIIQIWATNSRKNGTRIRINNGQWCNSVYDKLYNIAITSSYNLNEKWSFGANFALQTGQPVTIQWVNMNT
jgi:hypothetical protein